MFENLLSLYNPWWTNPAWEHQGVSRELYEKVVLSISTPYITVLKGCRQSGKTFLIKQCISEFIKQGIPAQNIFYFLLDDPEMAAYIENNPNEFANFLRNESHTKGKLWIFFDEFQKVKGITELAKIFYESDAPIHFVLTGSSSLSVADKISESLLGRTETHLLFPFSFKEFLSSQLAEAPFSFPVDEAGKIMSDFVRDPSPLRKVVHDFYSQYHFALETLKKLLHRYLLTGGYPQAALAKTSEDAFLRLKEIKQAFVEKDIVNLLRIEKLKEFDQLMRALALLSGSLINYNDLQNSIGINYQTMKNFMNILEAGYLWSPVSVFSTNKISSVKKRPKAFFNDVGLRNYLASTYSFAQLEKEKGKIAENFVHGQLTRFIQNQLNGFGQVQFWRSPDGNEIDFIFEHGGHLLPVEVKYQQTRQIKISRGFRTFLQKLEMETALIVSDDLMETHKIDPCEVFIIPLVLFAML